MDFFHNKRLMRSVAWGSVLFGLVMGGCQLLKPRNEWNKGWGPLVPHTSFPGDCGICHRPDGWDKLRDDFSFDHEKETGYRLEGTHSAAACLRCHNDRGPVQTYVARGCSGCHLDVHASSLGLDCERCHSQISWEPTGLLSEHARTRFPLMGAHAITACESCHEGAAAGQFRGAPTQCEICHSAALATAVNPAHAVNGWISDCQKCHQPSSWSGAFVPHDFFPLAGGHAALDCTQCHVGGVFTGLSSDCYSCHSANYQAAPAHVASNYSHDCTQCHSISGWLPAVFDHAFFALTGGHAGLDCSRCHVGGVYTGLSPDCYSCHSANYQSAPDHVAMAFPHDCMQCHTTSAWIPANFQHNFPLTGPHNVSCIECHTSGNTQVFNCLTCHEKTTTDEHHKEVSGYSYTSQACYQCHPNGTH